MGSLMVTDEVPEQPLHGGGEQSISSTSQRISDEILQSFSTFLDGPIKLRRPVP